jgi:hypothetical protein
MLLDEIIKEAPKLEGFERIGVRFDGDTNEYTLLFKRGDVLCTMRWDGVSTEAKRIWYDVLLDQVL